MISRLRSELLVATRNPGKIREIREAFRYLPLTLRYLDEFPSVAEVDELGQTYEQNAVLKAMSYSNQTGMYALADDSGLEVEALDGLPGVFSARFAGPHASDAERIDKLLAALSECPTKKRSARFVCSMALAGYENERETVVSTTTRLLKITEGSCEGVICNAARGTNGFGFDPVFMPYSYTATFAELPDEVKARISHRAIALNTMRGFLEWRLSQT